MKHALATAALLSAVTPTAAWAANEPVSTTVTQERLTSIEEGRLRVGGGFDLSFSDTIKNKVHVNLGAEYFVFERLSVGGTFEFSNTASAQQIWSLGPSATWYFFKQERLALYLGGGLAYAHGASMYDRSAPALISTMKLGTEFFITRSISFGPELRWRHCFQEVDPTLGLPRNETSAVGQFNIYF